MKTLHVLQVLVKTRVIPLEPIVETLGSTRLAALPAFHALSGADNTDSFAGKGKLKCWKAFETADDGTLLALSITSWH